MNRIKMLNDKRRTKLQELETLRTGAENRAFNAAEAARFDAIEKEILGLNADIEREARLATQHLFLENALA